MRFLDAFGVSLLVAASATMIMCSRPPAESSAPSAAVDVPPMNDGAPLAIASSQGSENDLDRDRDNGRTPNSCAGGFVEVIDASSNAIVARYQLGREIVANERGAKHPFAEHVIHHDGSIVFHLEALANADGHNGHVNLTVVAYREPKSFPAIFEPARAEYMPPGLDRESDERMQSVRIEITKWSDVGGFIEGSFAPSSVPFTPFPSAPQPTTSASFFPRPPPPPPPPPPSASFFPAPRPIPTQPLPRPLTSSSFSRPSPPPPPPPRASASAFRPSSSASAAFPMHPRPVVHPPYKGRFKVCRTADWHVRI